MPVGSQLTVSGVHAVGGVCATRQLARATPAMFTAYAAVKATEPDRPASGISMSISGTTRSIVIPDVVMVHRERCYKGALVIDLAPGVPVIVAASTRSQLTEAHCVTVRVYCPSAGLGAFATYILCLRQWAMFFSVWSDAWASFSGVNTAEMPWKGGDEVRVNEATGELRSTRVNADALATLALVAKRREVRTALAMPVHGLGEVGDHLTPLHHFIYGRLDAFRGIECIPGKDGATRLALTMPCGIRESTVGLPTDPATAASLAVAIARNRQTRLFSCCVPHAKHDVDTTCVGAGSMVTLDTGFYMTIAPGCTVTFDPHASFLLMAEARQDGDVKVSFGSGALSAKEAVCGSLALPPATWAAIEARVLCFLRSRVGVDVPQDATVCIAWFAADADVATGRCGLTFVRRVKSPDGPAWRSFVMSTTDARLSALERAADGTLVAEQVVMDHSSAKFVQRVSVPSDQPVFVRGLAGLPAEATVPIASLAGDTLTTLAALMTPPVSEFGPLASPLGLRGAVCAMPTPGTALLSAPAAPFPSAGRGGDDTPFTRGLKAVASNEDADVVEEINARLFPFGSVVPAA